MRTSTTRCNAPGDESRAKLSFYCRRGVREVLVVDPEARTAEWLTRTADGFEASESSRLLDLSAAELAAAIAWPPAV